MLIHQLTATIKQSKALDGFWAKLCAGQDATLGIANSARPLLIASTFINHPQPTFVVVAGEEASFSYYRQLSAYLGDDVVFHFPERTDYPFNAGMPDPGIVAQRMRAAHVLSSDKPCVVVASARSLLRLLPPASSRVCAPLVFSQGEDVSEGCIDGIASFEDVARALVERGYSNTGELEGKGTFCIRGGTIDVYPGNLVYPVRIDFFGDEIDEIRRIVPSTGQTISSLECVEVFPVREYACTIANARAARKRLENQARTNQVMRDLFEQLEGGLMFPGADAVLPLLYRHPQSLGGYCSKKTLTVIVEPRSLLDDADRSYRDICGRSTGSSIPVEGLYLDPSKLDFGEGVRATYLSLMRVNGSVDQELRVKRVDVAGYSDKLFERLRLFVDGGLAVVFSIPDHRARQRMESALFDYAIPFRESLGVDSPHARCASDRAKDHEGRETNLGKNDASEECLSLRRGMVNIVDVDIPLGMVIPDAKLALVSIADTKGANASRPAKHVDMTEITFPYHPGDYVVHATHGIAYFKEMVAREIDGTKRDYLLLEYDKGDKLFVPVEQLDRISRYVGADGASPRLTRLNTADWSRAIAKARKATKKLAFDLVDVYSRRLAASGYAYSPDTVFQREMEEAFPFEETPDQLLAIADVKADMESAKPMDRLICGDVGFGKTEVALRAAFKATQDGKQVMVLCPTTILAQQHYASFCERFDPFDIRVEILSRFRTPEQVADAIKGFKDGSVGVLVGTHRLLSRDVNPHDLGLVIIDEEQRFGVAHKEQMKNLRECIDVLTLSATPIPRTMQMSVSGVRDMSLILTPPGKRLPVKVHVGEWDPDIVSGAIRRELERGGQVYYVSNRVRTIDKAIERVTDAAPEARVGAAHGKMGKAELERVMEDFSARELDVLVATTIIESGIDNPHTNTLIIEDSQRLGLAQLYQLKGRVGRSAQQAYAFFMFPEQIPLTEEAEARLLAIDEHQELGSGIRIAMRDLEIRGAGSLLGAEQSGNLSSVGFDLFAQMLGQAVEAAREGSLSSVDGLPPMLSDITVNIPGHAYIPEECVPDADERVLYYRKLSYAASLEAVRKIEDELKERHPDCPDAVKNLFDKARIKAYACEHRISIVSIVSGNLSIEPIDIDKQMSITIRRAGGRYIASSKTLIVPVKALRASKEESLFGPVARFLQELAEGLSENQETMIRVPDSTKSARQESPASRSTSRSTSRSVSGGRGTRGLQGSGRGTGRRTERGARPSRGSSDDFRMRP